jgi:sugar phosphate isomerase/epimerase
MEPDLERTRDQFALLAEYAQQRGMNSSIEFAPCHPVGNLAAALAIVAHVGRPSFGLVIDAMHFFRSGGQIAELRSLDPARIGYVQLCDVPLQSRGQDYLQEAMFDRRAPGEGELPLAEFVAALPADVPISLEVPMLAKAQAGVGPYDRLRPAVDAAQALIRGVRR